MATRPPVVPHTTISDGEVLRIWGATELLDDYFDGLNPDSAEPPTERTEAVNVSTVNRYPGDAGFQRSAHNRTKSNEVGKGGPALPGKPFYCERTITPGLGPETVRQVRQFGYEGSFNALKKYARANFANGEFTLRNASGRSVEIATPPRP